ncbi:MAG: Gfo/Idh/MocA family oxidoreductase, partial [Planctomycetaceae bacterium]|nr:Gfo/Idh/MocA family oxidoreductase [Planctomycetaceae bacterium]
MPRYRSLPRRDFLKSTAGAALSAGLFAGFSRAADSTSPNEKLNIACIGTANRAAADIQGVEGENLVAFADVDSNYLDAVLKKFPGSRGYRDYREMLEQETGKIDAVVIGCTDHHHAPAAIRAIRKGLHVYCEKPLTHTVHEARLMTYLADRQGVATQMGTQIHAGDNYRRVVELVQSGAIGPVREVHVWVSRVWGWQESEEEATANNDLVFTKERPTTEDPIPDGLDWDLWLGPAPERPFNSVYVPGPKWYRWWDFGNGTMSDLGSHWNDLAYWALKLDAPLTIEAFGDKPHPEIAPASMSAVYEYGSRGDLPAVKHWWYQGTHKPEIWKAQGIPQWGSGTLFVGSEGMLL